MAWLEKRRGTWRVCWREGGKVRRINASTDKQVAKARLGELQKMHLRGEQYSDPYKVHRTTPITQHLADWISELRQEGRSESYVGQCDGRISRMIEECGWKLLADIKADAFIAWRETAKSDIAHNRKDQSKVERLPLASRTANHYLLALTTFCRWCVKRKRMATNPVADVNKVDETGDMRRGRRALSVDEVKRLLAAVPMEYRLLYRLILTTGLRRAEAGQLQWGDVRIGGPTPFIQLRAQTTKAKRADALPLRSDLAEELGKARGNAGDADRVFKRVPRIKEHRRWLKAAGIDYSDAAGRRVDLHALRHTYGTLLSKAGVSPRETMSLMRHTDLRLTMNVYTDPRVFDLAGAVEKLPLPKAENIGAVATGTDGRAIFQNVAGGRGANGVARSTAERHNLADLGAARELKGNQNRAENTGESRTVAQLGTQTTKERVKGVEPSTFTLAK